MASVKHLNPRQGITIADRWNELEDEADRRRVKHLNPRQGITIVLQFPLRNSFNLPPCETPKSPPGDYNYQTFILLTILSRAREV